MTSQAKDVVLVPGAWGTPASFQKLTSQLQSAGFTVHPVDLPSNNGSRPPNAGLDEDTQAVRQVIQKVTVDHGKPAILVMHSYGGAPGSNAAHGLTQAALKKSSPGKSDGGIVAMVFLAAYMLDEQWTVTKVIQQIPDPPPLGDCVSVEADGSAAPTDAGLVAMYHDLSPEDQEQQKSQILRWNAGSCNGVVAYAPWKEVPTYYIRTTEDRMVPSIYQDVMLNHAKSLAGGKAVKVIDHPSGHSVHAAAPEKCVEVVTMAVQEAAA